MLKVQEYLKSGKTFDDLNKELGIVSCFHKSLPLVILNYDMIESQKTHPIVKECRALILNKNTFDVVAKSFNRFFNLGEAPEEFKDFDFSNFIVDEKVDGSLVNIFKFEGQIVITTRGSFADGELQGYDQTWEHAISSALGEETKQKINALFDSHPYLNLVCEYCSLFNKVVREYKQPTVYLLSVFDYCQELEWDKVDYIAKQLEMKRPNRFHFANIIQVEEFIKNIGDTDKTFEGVVLRDINGIRSKVKSNCYIALHRLRGNNNIFLEKNIVPLVLAGEREEIFLYFPEIIEKYTKVETKMKEAYDVLEDVWEKSKDIENQKNFALAIVKKTLFSSILFSLKKKFGKNSTEKDLKGIWKDSGDLILKVLFS